MHQLSLLRRYDARIGGEEHAHLRVATVPEDEDDLFCVCCLGLSLRDGMTGVRDEMR
jgi:hypothetical protein